MAERDRGVSEAYGFRPSRGYKASMLLTCKAFRWYNHPVAANPFRLPARSEAVRRGLSGRARNGGAILLPAHHHRTNRRQGDQTAFMSCTVCIVDGTDAKGTAKRRTYSRTRTVRVRVTAGVCGVCAGMPAEASAIATHPFSSNTKCTPYLSSYHGTMASAVGGMDSARCPGHLRQRTGEGGHDAARTALTGHVYPFRSQTTGGLDA